MDKLSLYEILSFLIPGFLLIIIFDLYCEYVFGCTYSLGFQSEFAESIVVLSISMFLGILLHIGTFRLLKTSRAKWLNKLIFKSVQDIANKNEFVQKPISFLNKEYLELRKHEELPAKEGQIESNLFDFAYLYLEVNDKVTPSKNFQSLYFWLRNMFTISILLFPTSIIIVLITCVFDYTNERQISALIILVANIFLGLIMIPMANWIREKLVEKVLWSYYVDRVHDKKN